ncbi:MAG: hypothetical protein ACYSWW_00465 [Planctomycetota bacterium]
MRTTTLRSSSHNNVAISVRSAVTRIGVLWKELVMQMDWRFA